MAKYRFDAKAYGNHDHGPRYSRMVCKPACCFADTIEELQVMFREWIERNYLGAGNVSMVNVVEVETGNVVGYISYNGRFWEKDEYDRKYGNKN